MVSVAKRMRKLKSLLAVRVGPGAAVLPNEVKRIHMDFATQIYDGHLGAKKFWRQCLPRLKYHNPAISMTVNRTANQEASATMTVFLSQKPSSDSAIFSPAPISSTSTATSASDHTPFERVETIDMKHKKESEILSKLLELTGATTLSATPEERAEMASLKEQAVRSARDSEKGLALNAKKKQKEAILAQARGELAQQRAAAA